MGDNIMKNRVSLHTEPKKTAISSFLSALILLVLMFVFILSVNYDADELKPPPHNSIRYNIFRKKKKDKNIDMSPHFW